LVPAYGLRIKYLTWGCAFLWGCNSTFKE